MYKYVLSLVPIHMGRADPPTRVYNTASYLFAWTSRAFSDRVRGGRRGIAKKSYRHVCYTHVRVYERAIITNLTHVVIRYVYILFTCVYGFFCYFCTVATGKISCILIRRGVYYNIYTVNSHYAESQR